MNAVTAEFVMEDLVYPRERVLGTITLVLGILVWVVVLVCTVGVALIVLGLGALLSLFVHSALIAHLRGNAVELSEGQFPDLYAQFVECCRRLKIDTPPQAFILNGNGILNAFATKFLRTQYVVLTSDVVDAMQGNPEGLRFYMGHELGHLRMKHVSKQFLRWPVMWLPLLGAAYSRARESTCDRHGLACSGSVEAAVRALGVLSVGRARWRNLNVATYIRQTEHSRGFWMSFHELTAGYPWLTKRAARLTGDPAATPGRNPFAYFLALFVPYGGRLGSGFTMLIMIYVTGMLAATAIPAYQTYVAKAKLTDALIRSEPVRQKLAEYYLSNHRVPDSLETLGVAAQLPNGITLSLDSQRMVLSVNTKQGELIFVPSNAHGRIAWSCRAGEGFTGNLNNRLPLSCRQSASQ
jgi:Zn-dependent protease with chaperone function/type II secretory pathway pseudopilin PulG